MKAAPTHGQTLRRLYMSLFLRGRSSRGLNREKAPKSVGSKLFSSLLLYALIGVMALSFIHQPLFLLSTYLHGMTLLFLGMFIAGSAGEVLFNREEAEILLHRPVTARELLSAKIRVLVEVSLWLAFSFNLVGCLIGTFGPHGSPTFIFAHLLTTAMAAVLCTACVVLIYQLCLRWFGRERLENLMTTAQVLLGIGVMAGSQAVPFLMRRLDPSAASPVMEWWIHLVPPAWFAGLDALLGGDLRATHIQLAALAVTATLVVPWLALGKLAGDYQSGLQTLSESRPRKSSDGKPRLLDRLMRVPPVAWLLREPLTRACFRLTAAYLFRDRDMKLRFFPGLAPALVMPVVFLMQGFGQDSNFGIIMAGGYLAILPVLALNLLQYSQQWQASDLFRYAPLAGPAPLIHGARHAVTLLVALPCMIVLAVLVALFPGGADRFHLLLPGLIALPVYGLITGATGKAIPLSRPTEEAKSAGRGLSLVLLMFSSFAVSGLAVAAAMQGWFGAFLIVETAAALALGTLLNRRIQRLRWEPLE